MLTELKSKIRDVKDFPKKGINFKDITTLIKDPKALQQVIEIFYVKYKDSKIDVVTGIEARGFILGSILAYKLGVGFVPLRKPGKLPAKIISAEYDLEYGTDTLCVHEDAILKGENVLIVDDLIATGGSVQVACNLIEKLDAKIITVAVLVELEFLKGRDKVKSYDIFSILKY
ncbi:MAG: adenine phosphoribosyltransferase [bacterium]|nr:adenine phosphoribosyltransferase [bacterium]